MVGKISKFCLFIIVNVFFVTLCTGELVKESQKSRIQEDVVTSSLFREQNIGETMCEFLQTSGNPGKNVGIYLLESKFGYQEWEGELDNERFTKLEKDWKTNENYNQYIEMEEAIWNDIKYFPFHFYLLLKYLYI